MKKKVWRKNHKHTPTHTSTARRKIFKYFSAAAGAAVLLKICYPPIPTASDVRMTIQKMKKKFTFDSLFDSLAKKPFRRESGQRFVEQKNFFYKFCD